MQLIFLLVYIGYIKYLFFYHLPLFRSWSHNPAATFSLCLLSQLYEHTSHLVQKL